MKPIAHLYKSQVYDAGASAGRARGDPPPATPTTDTFSMPQTQEEFYFALPFDKMDLCLYGLEQRRADRPRWPRRSDAHPDQVEAAWRDIEARSGAPTRYLHLAPIARGRGWLTCAESRGSSTCTAAPPPVRRAEPDGRRAPPSRPGRVRRLSRPRSPGWATPACRSSTWRRPAAARAARRHAVGGLQRRDLQLPRAARRARGARSPVPDPQRHRGHRSTPTSSGATTRFVASTASGRWPSGTPDAGG